MDSMRDQKTARGPAGACAGESLGLLALGAALVALVGFLIVLAVGRPSSWTGVASAGQSGGGGGSGFGAAPATARPHAATATQVSCSSECFGVPARPLDPALQLQLTPRPTPVVDPMDEFGPTTEARGFISAQLSAFDALTQVWQSGLLSREDFDAQALQSAGGVAPVIGDLQRQPMKGSYALSREALLYGLHAVDHMWRATLQNGTVDAADYQVAQASLAVSARYVPGVPPAQP